MGQKNSPTARGDTRTGTASDLEKGNSTGRPRAKSKNFCLTVVALPSSASDLFRHPDRIPGGPLFQRSLYRS